MIARLGRVTLVVVALLVATRTAESAAAPDRVASDSSRTAAATRGTLDLNHATRDQLIALPVPPAIADAILDHRTYTGWFTSAWQLLDVPGVTPELFAEIRGRVEVSPVFEAQRREMDEAEVRSNELNYLVQRLLSEEGASEGLVDAYLDQVRQPRDLNQLDYFDLSSFQNVSPVDAVAILGERGKADGFQNESQLRAAPGLSYWGFRNLRNYVSYGQPTGGRPWHVDAQFRVYNTPYMLDDWDVLTQNIINDTSGLTPDQAQAFRNYDLNTYAGRMSLGSGNPASIEKIRARWGAHLEAGLLASRNVGEPDWNTTARGYVAVQKLRPLATPLGPFQLERAVVGSYSVAFGLGLVMDATDYFQARRTGLGYTAHPVGLVGDLSRTDEYGLKGAAAEASLGPLRGTFFVSRDNKDAILNPDGSFNRYFRMVPRVTNELLAEIRDDIRSGVFAGRGDTAAFLPMRDVMDERVFGSNLRWEFAPGTWVGATGMQIDTRNRAFSGPMADRWNPDPLTLVIDPNRIEDRDAEIGGSYDSRALGSYRRLWGTEAQTVWRNLSFAGEYGKLENSTASEPLKRVFSNGPEAFVTQGYAQWENLTLVALYRDYDIGYDDPYNRAFSEDSRYEQTILDGNAYRLNNPYWAMLALDDPQPKAEQGWFFTTRWQPTRQFIVDGLEYDTWRRKADAADLSRIVARVEYRPIFPLRMRLRHAISSRHADRPDDVRSYTAWDSRLELLANLSNFDQVRFLYSTGNVAFAARGRLSGPAAGGDVQSDTTANRGSPAQALAGQFIHQFSSNVAMILSSEVFDGFLWNYEDNEFVVVDGRGFRNWVMFRSQISPNLAWRFKWTSLMSQERTYVDIRNFGVLVPPTPDGTHAMRSLSAFRFQLDLSL